MKKAQLHHKGSDGKREEDSEAGNGDSPGTVGALVHALVAGAAIRGALFLDKTKSLIEASKSAKHISREALFRALSGGSRGVHA